MGDGEGMLILRGPIDGNPTLADGGGPLSPIGPTDYPADDMVRSTLEGQVAVVTGGARGLGFAIARRLLGDGARDVALFDRDEEAVNAAKRRLGAGDKVSAWALDVSDAEAVGRAVDAGAERHGRIDILVNNAGIFPHTPFDELDVEEWRRVMSTNLDGVFVCSRAVYPHMRQRGYGRIVNISSATFFIGYPEMSAYIASKGGIVGFTRALASAAGPHGIIHMGPVFRDLELERHGAQYVWPDNQFAHVFPDGRALVGNRSLERTVENVARFSRRDAEAFREVAAVYRQVLQDGMIPAMFN